MIEATRSVVGPARSPIALIGLSKTPPIIRIKGIPRPIAPNGTLLLTRAIIIQASAMRTAICAISIIFSSYKHHRQSAKP